MTLANTSRASLAYGVEGTFGTPPSDANGLRFTGESLDFGISTVSTSEIRNDRTKSDLILVGAAAKGAVNFEMSYNEYDALLEAALQGTWAVYGVKGVGATFTATFLAGSITAGVAPTGASAFSNLSKGQWIKIVEPSGANDGAYLRISSSVAPTTTVITLDPATPATASGPTALSKVVSSRLVNGSTQRSFTLEKTFNDITQMFRYKGMTVSKLAMALKSGSIVTGSFDFMGKDVSRGTSTIFGGTVTAATANGLMNAVRGVGQIMEGGALLSGTFIKQLTLDHDNKLRARDGIGNLGAVSIGSGTAETKGTIDVYLADGTMYDKFVNNTATSLSWRVVDDSGNGYIFTLPRVKYSDGKVNAAAQDQDAMISMPFEAIYDSTLGISISVDRVGVAVA